MKFANFISRNSLGISPEQGASPLVHLATAPSTGVPSGTYFDGLKPFGRIDGSAKKPGAAEALWVESARLVSLT